MTHRIIGVAAAVVLGIASRASAQNVITQPDWAVRPNAESFARHYPKLATQLELSGSATIACKVNVEGRLVDCHVVVERPAGLGFGQAVVDMSAEFRMKPLAVNGKPVEGGTVRIPIRFVTPQGEPRPALPAPVSEAAAQQAYRAVDGFKLTDRAIESYEKLARRIELMGDDRTVAQAAADAYREAAAAHRKDVRAGLARAYASVFSEDEMAGLAEFAEAGGADGQGQSSFEAVQVRVRKDSQRNFTALAHASFCAKAACGTTADLEKVLRPGDPRDTGRIDSPQWARQPGEGDFNRARPVFAGPLAISGVVRMTCRLTDVGGLRDCEVDAEAPTGLGFGMAAKDLGRFYRISDIQRTQGSVGRKVTLRIDFTAPTTDAPFQVKPGGAAAMALARQLADPAQMAAESQLQSELQIVGYETNPPKGVDPKLTALAIEAYREATKQAVSDYIEQSISNAATAWSERQLTARLAFKGSAAAKAQASRGKELNIAVANAQDAFSRQIVADVRTAFCAGRGCIETPPPAQPNGASTAPSTPKP